MPGPSVSLFNTNSLPVQVTVNNGTTVAIQGASWPQLAPQTPASGNPNWDYGGPSPNTLGPGTNSLTVTPQGMMQPFVFQVGIPGNFQWQSVQLYLFVDTSGSLAWVLLNGGSFVSSGTARGQ